MVRACVCSWKWLHSLVPISGYPLSLRHLVLDGPFFPAVYQGRGVGRDGGGVIVWEWILDSRRLLPWLLVALIRHPARAAGSQAAGCLMKTERRLWLCAGPPSHQQRWHSQTALITEQTFYGAGTHIDSSRASQRLSQIPLPLRQRARKKTSQASNPQAPRFAQKKFILAIADI